MRLPTASLVVAALPLVAGCGAAETQAPCTLACSQCPPAATVVVSDARTGQPVPGAAVTGGRAAWSCGESAGKAVCTSMQGTPVAPFEVQVTAPGYAPATAHVATVEQPSGTCCPACLTFTPATVQLSPT